MSLNIKTSTGRQILASNGDILIGGKDYEVYSENETMIGYWTDGRPLYRKVYNLGNQNFTTNFKEISMTGLPSPSCVKNIQGSYSTSDGYRQGVGLSWGVKTNQIGTVLQVQMREGIIGLYTSTFPITYANVSIVLEYTKTTDTSITNNNTYSTDEVLTGETWIDGKPIYRKVINGLRITTANGYTNYDLSQLNFDEIITRKAFLNYNAENDIISHTIPWTTATGKVLEISFSKINKILKIYCTQESGGYMYDETSLVTVILEYTKTID